MKKLLLILLCLPLLFTTCKKDEELEVLPCLCEDNGNPILITGINIEEHKDKNDNRNFDDLINELDREQRIERYRISSLPFLVSEQSAFITGNDTICKNQVDPGEIAVSFSGVSPFTFVYAIDGNSQLPITTYLNPYIIETKQEGFYSLVSYSDINGTGIVSGQGIITVLDPPVADFIAQPDTLSIINTTVQFNDVSIGNISDWLWDFGDNSPLDYNQNTYHTYTDSVGIYQVSLIVQDNFGCTDTISKYITVKDEYWIYIPNAFTPNSDNVNDKFRISYNGVRENTFTINIYSCSGERVYAGYDIAQLETNGWDGKHQITGDNLPTGVYTYSMYYQDFEGWQYQANGTISIIRDVLNLSDYFICYPQGVSNCKFGDMIHPQQGFIYPTQEDINNW